MIMCFGAFASILNCCTNGLPQFKFIPRVAWVIDRRNSSLASGLDFDVDDPDDMEGNKEVVSRLLSCERPLVVRDKQLPSLAVAHERFKSKVMPFIKDDKMATAVLAILNIISQDDAIEVKYKEAFKKHLGMDKAELLRQKIFDVPDFFARVLLYTTCVDNREGQPFVEDIKNGFIEKTANDIWAESKWDATAQIVEIVPSGEKRFWDEINVITELRLSLMADQQDFADTSWLGIDERILFPSRYKPIEFEDPATKRIVSNKMVQYIKLVREFIDCLSADQQFTSGQAMEWPIFPNEKTRTVRQQLRALGDELLALVVFPEHLTFE